MFNAIPYLFSSKEGERFCLQGRFSVSDVLTASGWKDVKVKVTLANGNKNKEKENERESTEPAKDGEI